MVICLERGADLHMAQLMPLPLIVFCFLVPAHLGSPGRRAVKRVMCCYIDLSTWSVLLAEPVTQYVTHHQTLQRHGTVIVHNDTTMCALVVTRLTQSQIN